MQIGNLRFSAWTGYLAKHQRLWAGRETLVFFHDPAALLHRFTHAF